VASLVIVVSAALVLLCRETDRITHSDAAKRFIPATVVGVSKKTDKDVAAIRQQAILCRNEVKGVIFGYIVNCALLRLTPAYRNKTEQETHQ